MHVGTNVITPRGASNPLRDLNERFEKVDIAYGVSASENTIRYLGKLSCSGKFAVRSA